MVSSEGCVEDAVVAVAVDGEEEAVNEIVSQKSERKQHTALSFSVTDTTTIKSSVWKDAGNTFVDSFITFDDKAITRQL
jgi:hypothetical protein